MTPQENNGLIVLFDGLCVLCSRAVRFIIRNDPGKLYRFAAIQSETGQKLIGMSNPENFSPDTVILVENGRVFVRSTAMLKILKNLSGLWPVLYCLIIVPEPVRDFFYKFVAGKRYRWFGKYETCMVPDRDLRSRFIDHPAPDKQ